MKRITHEGILKLGGNLELPCYVLEDKTRVLSSRGMQQSLKMVDESKKGKQEPGTRFNRFLTQKSLQPYINKGGNLGPPTPVICYKGKTKISGYEATILVDLCDAILEARKSNIELGRRQLIIAEQAEILVRGFARVGIISLVDEATGYQDTRVKDALQKILDKFLLNEAKKYRVTFPIEFYKQIFRLNNWEWKPESARKKPGVIAKWTTDFVYKRLIPGVLKELELRNPKTNKGRREKYHHQFLTDEVGEPKLKEHFVGIIALMKANQNMRRFKEMLNRVYPKYGEQLTIDLND